MAIGNSLKSLLRHKKITLPEAISISWKILDWLEELHIANLKQHNFHTDLFIYHNETNKIIFPEKDSPLLQEELPPEYLAPEETGRLAQTHDYRADLYRLGIIWYELFTGKPPFLHEDRFKVIWQHLAETPPQLNTEGLSPIAIRVIEKLLSKRADQRYTTLKGLRHDWSLAFTEKKNHGNIAEIFVPGSFDFPETFTLPPILSAHNSEIKKVLSLGEQVLQNQSKAFLWVQGKAYSGKTTFLDQCSEQLLRKGFRCFRSACLPEESIPYHAIKTAFDRFAQSLHFLYSVQESKITTLLKHALGDKLSVLTSFAPQWESILGKHPPAALLDGSEVQNRLSFVLAKTLSLIATDEKPVVFILDDIQYISLQSLRLLNAMFAEPDLKNILIIVSAEIGSEQNIIPDIHKEILNTSNFQNSDQIVLNSLSVDSISHLLKDLRIDPNSCDELAILMERKSGGYPVFIRNLIYQAIQNNFFKPGNQKKWWQVDLKAFATLSTTENLLAHQQEKLKQLEPEAIEYLKIASCIGQNFDAPTIKAVLNNPPQGTVEKTTMELQKMEIIVPNLYNDDFRFSNPDLHKTINKSIEADKVQNILKKIIDFKIQQENYSETDNGLYNLLGYILQLPDEQMGEYKHFVQQGADRAKLIGAFDEAARYYKALLVTVLPQHENERFELHAQLLEMLIGDLRFDEYYKVKNSLNTLFTLDEIRRCKLDLIECRSLLVQQKMPEVVTFAQLSLQRMGITISLEPSILRIILSLIKVQVGMKNRSIDDLENLPLTEDNKTKYILQLLQDTSSAFFLAAPKALPEVLALQINMGLKKGISETMGVVFAAYGFNLSSFTNQFAKAEEMMTLARNLDQRFGNIKGSVVVRFLHAALTRHWHYTFKENALLLNENYQFGRENGILQMAFFSLATGDILLLYSGKPFSEIIPQIEKNMQACMDKQQHAMVDFLKMTLQFFEDLNGTKQPDQLMEGDQFCSSIHRPEFIKKNLQTNTAILFGLESLLSLIWNKHDGEKIRLKHLLKLLEAVGLSSVSLLVAIACTSINAYKLKTSPNKDMRKARKKIKSWAKQAPFNFGGWYHLLEGVVHRNQEDLPKALYHMEQAIFWASNQNILYIKALALQEKAEIQMEWSPTESIPEALLEAHACYYKWGAVAKCKQLEKDYPSIKPLIRQTNTSSYDVDLVSLLRASNSIASEINLEILLEKLTTILIENAGAQTAIIILPDQNTLEEVARKTGQSPVSFEKIKVSADTHPLNMLGIVKRSQHPELVNNPADNPIWASDPYIIKHKPLSILCIPVVKNQVLLAIIYLENNLTSGAFTMERLELIKLLSGQIAISLENAELYIDMGNRVKERTSELFEKNIEVENQKNKLVETLNELQSTQAKLVQQAKLASLGQLTAGIAHEIKNPLNFVTNFSDLSRELIDEVFEELEKVESSNAKEEISNLLRDVRSNLEKVHEHGTRANSIITSMLQHSRASGNKRAPKAFNALVKEFVTLSFQGMRAGKAPIIVAIDLQLDSNVGEVMLISEDFSRVILNICNNAFDVMRDKLNTSKIKNSDYHPKLTVKTALQKEKVLLSISDNGAGISKEIRGKILQPFFTTKKGTEGTGLGLSISNDIIQAHGGELIVESEEGQGSVFIIQLPVV